MSFLNDSLITLNNNCQAHIKLYKSNQSNEGSPSCREILRRAVAGDSDAWEILLEITKTYIVKTYLGRVCPKELKNEQEDIVQDVLVRLDNRIRRPTKQPYQVREFPQYWKFVETTIWTVITEHGKIATRIKKIEQALEKQGETSVPAEQFTSEEIIEHIHARFQMWADRVSESKQINILRQWKAIYLRHFVGKTNQEIAQDFQSIDPTITVRRVSKYVELGLDRIRKDAYLCHLFGRNSTDE